MFFEVFEKKMGIKVKVVDIVLDDYDMKFIMMFFFGDMIDVLMMKNFLLYLNYVLWD